MDRTAVGNILPGTHPELVSGNESMLNLMTDVGIFHAATDTPILQTPQPVAHRKELRMRLINEEIKELTEAVEANDIINIADAIADAIYVLIGTALEFGIPLDRVWEEVVRTNNAKINPETGKVTKRADGKVLKPAGWVPPRIYEALFGGLYEDDQLSTPRGPEEAGNDTEAT